MVEYRYEDPSGLIGLLIILDKFNSLYYKILNYFFMKVILLQDIEKIGKKDEVKEVADGFARNFLIPKKLAIIATSKELEKLRKRKEQIEKMRKEEEEKIKGLAERIKGLEIVLKEKVNPEGKLYGSVGREKIASLLKENGFGIDENKVDLVEPIKDTGKFEVEINLFPDLKTKIKLKIIAEE